jgi:hypothetical protein
MAFLYQTTDTHGCKVNLYISYKTHESKVLSEVFRSYEKLLHTTRVLSTFFWKSINECYIIWVENLDGKVLSGLVFRMDTAWQTGINLLGFTDPKYEKRGLAKLCVSYYITKIKELGAIRTHAGCVIDNNDILRTDEDGTLRCFTGGKVKWVTYTKKLK